MNYFIRTISYARYLFIIFTAIFIIFSSFILSLVFSKIFTGEIFMMVVALLVLFIIFGLGTTKSDIKIILTDDILEFGNTKINLKDIKGYYINTQGLSMTEIQFRMQDKDYKITSGNTGKNGSEFKRFLSDFVERINNVNNEIVELGFYDFHPGFQSFQNKLIPILGVILLVLNVLYLYIVFSSNVEFNIKLIIVDLLYLAVFASHRYSTSKKRNDS